MVWEGRPEVEEGEVREGFLACLVSEREDGVFGS